MKIDVHSHVFEPSQRVEMKDGFADVADDKRLSQAHDDERREGGLGRLPAIEHQPNRCDSRCRQ